MAIRIALAGNPNSGKTTVFNALTGSNQFVGNWPGVTVEKKEGKLKGDPGVTVTDLPGIYSLSPYSPEEIVARDFLLSGKPDAVLNVVDGTNLERSLYLTTQLMEAGVPVVVALNMMDVVSREGTRIGTEGLAKALGCPVAEVSALRDKGLMEAARQAVAAAQSGRAPEPVPFRADAEAAIADVARLAGNALPEANPRWYAVKLFERDPAAIRALGLDAETLSNIERRIAQAEAELDDDAQSIVTNERYTAVSAMLEEIYRRRADGKPGVTERIDRVVTNRFLALPIFALAMFLLYFISVTTVGAWATGWANDGVFGDGWHLTGGGRYAAAQEAYGAASVQVEAFEVAAARAGLEPMDALGLTATAELTNEGGIVTGTLPTAHADYLAALSVPEPDPAEFGVWVPGIPVLLEGALARLNVAPWMQGLLLEGVVGGVGAVLGFVPQIFVLFLLLGLLEGSGYMARVAFIMDRMLRRFGLSGKSFIPMLIGTGCSVPGILASRTIENPSDRRMTIITTSFMPCGAKLPVIALFSGAVFGGAPWVAPSAYFLGVASILMSGVILRKSRAFSAKPLPFVMELPAYRLPTARNLLRGMWERGLGYVRKAGTIVLLMSIVIWFISSFGWTDGRFGWAEAQGSVLAAIGGVFAPLIAPLGWGSWQPAAATISGLIAKENVVSTMGVLSGSLAGAGEGSAMAFAKGFFTPQSAYSFLVFNLLCIPCFAAVGAIRREMGSPRWTAFALLYQTALAYTVSLILYQGSMLMGGAARPGGLAAAALALCALTYLFLRRPYQPVAA